MMTGKESPTTIVANLAFKPNICALLAVGEEEVLLLHNFFYDRKLPTQPGRTGHIFGLQGTFRSPNPVSFAPMEALEKLSETNGLPLSDWPDFDLAADANAICKLEAKKQGAPDSPAVQCTQCLPPSWDT